MSNLTSAESIAVSVPGMMGSPAFVAAILNVSIKKFLWVIFEKIEIKISCLAATLSPIRAMTEEVGPINWIPASSQAYPE